MQRNCIIKPLFKKMREKQGNAKVGKMLEMQKKTTQKGEKTKGAVAQGRHSGFEFNGPVHGGRLCARASSGAPA